MPDPLEPPVRRLNRYVVIGASVILFHAAALWALQSGLVRRAIEVVVPVAMVTEIITPPAPAPAPAPEPTPPVPAPATPKPPPRVRQPAARQPQPAVPKPAPAPVPQPVSEAPSSVAAAVSPPAPSAPVAAPAVAGPPSPAPVREPAPKVELPSSNASYLQNPLPAYPPMSKRLGEQGKVVVRVLIGADGTPQQAQLKVSSGFDRLDRAALDYVMKCRYVPGKVGSVPQAMWHDAPVNFVLE